MRRSILASTIAIAVIGSAAAVHAAPVTATRPALALVEAEAQAEPVRYRYYSYRGFRSHGFRGYYRSHSFHRGFGFRRNPFISLR